MAVGPAHAVGLPVPFVWSRGAPAWCVRTSGRVAVAVSPHTEQTASGFFVLSTTRFVLRARRVGLAGVLEVTLGLGVEISSRQSATMAYLNFGFFQSTPSTAHCR